MGLVVPNEYKKRGGNRGEGKKTARAKSVNGRRSFHGGDNWGKSSGGEKFKKKRSWDEGGRGGGGLRIYGHKGLGGKMNELIGV